MHDQTHNKAQLIPMTVRVDEVTDEETLNAKGTDEELVAYCDVKCEWGDVADTDVENEKKDPWKKYNFQKPETLEYIEEIILKCYNKIKEQEILLAYIYLQLELTQRKDELTKFTSYFEKKGIKFLYNEQKKTSSAKQLSF